MTDVVKKTPKNLSKPYIEMLMYYNINKRVNI